MQRGMLRLVVLGALAASLAVPASASAIADPQQLIGGAGSKWYSGSAIQQPGENCSVLGEPYTEIMVNGVGSYGGAPGGGVVHVNDQYWASLLVGVPGNPCGSGSTSVATDLKLPAHTAYDPSRPIRCFGTNRFSSDFFEITNQTWSFLGQSGRYCPTGPSAGAPSGVSGAQNYGFRPLANGQLFEIFVPVKTTAELHGAGEAGEAGEFNWLTVASAADANPYRSYTWANVFPQGGGGSPFIYFARTPSAIPFWDSSAPAGAENRVEFFVNLYSAGTGTGTSASYLHYTIKRTDTNATVATDALDGAYDGTVPTTPDSVQLLPTGPEEGPNGGYVPFYYDPNTEANVPMTITWDYCYGGGSNCSGASHVTGSQSFRTLAGPDLDGDGVADSADKCKGVKGILPNGCLPVPKLQGGAGLKKGAKLRKRRLKRGLSIPVTCNLSSKVATKLIVRGKTVGSGRGSCTPAGGGKVKLKLTRRGRRTLRGRHRGSLTFTFTKKGSKASKVKLPVRIS